MHRRFRRRNRRGGHLHRLLWLLLRRFLRFRRCLWLRRLYRLFGFHGLHRLDWVGVLDLRGYGIPSHCREFKGLPFHRQIRGGSRFFSTLALHGPGKASHRREFKRLVPHREAIQDGRRLRLWLRSRFYRLCLRGFFWRRFHLFFRLRRFLRRGLFGTRRLLCGLLGLRRLLGRLRSALGELNLNGVFMHLECARLPGGFLHTLFALLVQRFKPGGDLLVHLLIGRIEQVGENRPRFIPHGLRHRPGLCGRPLLWLVRLCAARLQRFFVLLFIFLQGLQLQPIVNIFLLGRKDTGLLFQPAALLFDALLLRAPLGPAQFPGLFFLRLFRFCPLDGVRLGRFLCHALRFGRGHSRFLHLFSRLGLLALHWTAHRLFYRLLRNGFARLFHRRGLGALRSWLLIGSCNRKGDLLPLLLAQQAGFLQNFFHGKVVVGRIGPFIHSSSPCLTWSQFHCAGAPPHNRSHRTQPRRSASLFFPSWAGI